MTWPLNGSEAGGDLAAFVVLAQSGLYQSKVTSSLASIRRPGAHFSKAPESFRARKAIFSSAVFKNGEVYTPETSCMKETSVHVKNM